MFDKSSSSNEGSSSTSSSPSTTKAMIARITWTGDVVESSSTKREPTNTTVAPVLREPPLVVRSSASSSSSRPSVRVESTLLASSVGALVEEDAPSCCTPSLHIRLTDEVEGGETPPSPVSQVQQQDQEKPRSSSKKKERSCDTCSVRFDDESPPMIHYLPKERTTKLSGRDRYKMWYTRHEFKMILIKCNEKIEELIDLTVSEQQDDDDWLNSDYDVGTTGGSTNGNTNNDDMLEKQFEYSLMERFRGYEYMVDDDKVRQHRHYVISQTLQQYRSNKKDAKQEQPQQPLKSSCSSSTQSEPPAYKIYIQDATQRALSRAHIDQVIVQEMQEEEEKKRLEELKQRQQQELKQKNRLERRKQCQTTRKSWLLLGGSGRNLLQKSSSNPSITTTTAGATTATSSSANNTNTTLKPQRSWSAPSLLLSPLKRRSMIMSGKRRSLTKSSSSSSLTSSSSSVSNLFES